MKATISRTQLDIDYKCPNCYLHFRLSNQDIPQETDITYNRHNITVVELIKEAIKDERSTTTTI